MTNDLMPRMNVWKVVAIVLIFTMVNCYFASRAFDLKYDQVRCEHKDIGREFVELRQKHEASLKEFQEQEDWIMSLQDSILEKEANE